MASGCVLSAQAVIGIKDLKYVVCYDKPLIQFERLWKSSRNACVVEES